MKPSLFDRAVTKHQQGDFTNAQVDYLAFLADNPHHADTLHLLGLLYAQKNQYELAIHYITQALTIHQDSPLYHNNLGNAYKNLKNYEDARRHYQQAMTLDPNYAEAHNNIGTLYYLEQQWQEALHHYQVAMHLKPHYLEAHRNCGMLMMHLGNLEAATTQFLNVIALNPNDWQAHHQLGNIHLHHNDLDQALAAYLAVLSHHSDHIPTLNNLGVIHIKRNEDQKAIAYFTDVLTVDETNIEARNNSAALFMKHQRYDNAIAHYEEILEKNPTDLEAHYNRSVAHMGLGHWDLAIEGFQKIIQHDPHHGDAHANLGALYIERRELQKARIHLNAALLEKPNDAVIQHMLDAINGANKNSVPPSYVKNLFDQYAERYNQHLQQTLQYTLPKKLFTWFAAQMDFTHTALNILDIGCGTGLCGSAFSVFAKKLTGIDLSEKMIDIARSLTLYDDLIVGDFNHTLDLSPASFDLIIAAEVFEYFGDLTKSIQQCADYLKPNGSLLFSIESTTHYPYALQKSARFAHHLQHIHEALEHAGFDLISSEETVARLQEGQAFKVLMVLARLRRL